jgi:8-oxo-dGTP pyrophosphatase MutT (NUDIX family)
MRSGEVNEPYTWGVWGGAVDAGEDGMTAARRELAEESGYVSSIDMRLIHTFRHPSGFVYETYLAEIDEEFEPCLCCETEEARWFVPGRWPAPLHFGLAEVIEANAWLSQREKGWRGAVLPRIIRQCRSVGGRRGR